MLSMISRKLVISGFLVILTLTSSFACGGWIVRKDGVGPVKIGMRLANLNVARKPVRS